MLLHVQRSGEHGSPASNGSSNLSRSLFRVASTSLSRLRPPPTLRMRFSGATGWRPPRRRCLTFFPCLTSPATSVICCSLVFCSNSFNPAAIVLREAPVASATLDVPPQPADFASAAKYSNRESKCGFLNDLEVVCKSGGK
jgi:hypothetical protein